MIWQFIFYYYKKCFDADLALIVKAKNVTFADLIQFILLPISIYILYC